MGRSSKVFVCVAALVAAAGCDLLPLKQPPGRCWSDSDCGGGLTCDLTADECVCSGPSCADAGVPDGGSPDGRSDAGDGRQCSSSASCKDPTKPYCSADGACVECSTSSQCTKDPTKPYCSADGACVGCAQLDAQACGTMDTRHPVCGAAGACVECSTSSQCTKDPTKSVCDTGTKTCRGCQADAECSSGPQVCMKHQDGRCATAAETIYVQKTVGCPGSAVTADGSQAMPYCSMDPAVAAVGSSRDLIVVRGTVNSAAASIAGGQRQLSLVGQMNATISGADPAVHLATGDLYVRGVKLGPSAAIGCQADAGSTLRLDHVAVTGNSGGGILLNGAAFDIENTTVTNNGPGTFGVASWGGVLVNNPPAAGPTKLQLVTVQNNLAPGVSCSAAVSGTATVLASGNSTRDVTQTCDFTPCAAASAICGAQP